MPCGLPEPDEQPKEPDPLVIAFLQGAKWWEWMQKGATMWPSDQQHAVEKAEAMLSTGVLGKQPLQPPKRKQMEDGFYDNQHRQCREHWHDGQLVSFSTRQAIDKGMWPNEPPWGTHQDTP